MSNSSKFHNNRFSNYIYYYKKNSFFATNIFLSIEKAYDAINVFALASYRVFLKSVKLMKKAIFYSLLFGKHFLHIIIRILQI